MLAASSWGQGDLAVRGIITVGKQDYSKIYSCLGPPKSGEALTLRNILAHDANMRSLAVSRKSQVHSQGKARDATVATL